MYQNPFAAGYEVFSKTSSYNIGSHGDLSATANYLINNDFPDYTAMFYHPTEHEVISSIKYRNENPAYDSAFREIQESMQGLPLEFYIPHSISVADGIGKSTDLVLKNPFKDISEKINKKIIDEIAKAQQEVSGKELILRETEIEEKIITRKFRKREIIFRNSR